MPVITRELLRKRAEHNEGIISTLEEVSLHQEELEGINEVLGVTCRKIKILYLQNNIIPKIQNLTHLKDLEYLNLALNNIRKIEGLQSCEFLKKLDLTVNFIDVDELKESIDHLQSRHCLRELYMMGNPAEANWDKFKSYVIAKLPQLQSLDGTEITKSMRIIATQNLPAMEEELRHLAAAKRAELEAKNEEKCRDGSAPAKTIHRGDVVVEELGSDDDDYEGPVREDEELTENTPETRVEMYREIAEQKREKAERARANAPPERDYEKEHAEAVAAQRRKEEEMGEREVRQKNEGGFPFSWDEEGVKGSIVLEVSLPRHLDSSLIDVDVHPTYVSIIVKGKTLRLALPSEVRAGDTKCQRSKTSGALVLTMPKVNPRETTVFSKKLGTKPKPKPVQGKVTKDRTKEPRKLTLQEQMLAAAQGTTDTAAKTNESRDRKSVV